jgi:hypothetical protein
MTKKICWGTFCSWWLDWCSEFFFIGTSTYWQDTLVWNDSMLVGAVTLCRNSFTKLDIVVSVLLYYYMIFVFLNYNKNYYLCPRFIMLSIFAFFLLYDHYFSSFYCMISPCLLFIVLWLLVFLPQSSFYCITSSIHIFLLRTTLTRIKNPTTTM